MVKLLLVNPGTRDEQGVHPPLNLLALAAYVRQKSNHEVRIADQIAKDNVTEIIKKYSPDFVGITGTTAVIYDAYEIAKWCKENHFKTIIGGVHATVMTEEALQYGDYVVKGEGEEALLKILDGKAKERIVTGDFIKNLDDLPKLDYSLVNMNFYHTAKDRCPQTHIFFVPPHMKVGAIIAARGCPYNCIFCHNSWRGLPVRLNSAKRIIEEMLDLKNNYGTQVIFFMDDDFLCSKNRVMEFSELYKKEKIDLIWGCQARVKDIDEEIVKTLESCNCKQITFGMESGSPRILKLLKNDKVTIEDCQNAIDIIKKNSHIIVSGSFMIGSPTETVDDIMMTKEFIKKSGLDAFSVAITTPFPGTKLWEMCKEKGLIPEKVDWKLFNGGFQLTFPMSEIPNDELLRLYKELTNLSLGYNLRMDASSLFSYVYKHPLKVIKKVLTNPKSVYIVFKKVFLKKNK